MVLDELKRYNDLNLQIKRNIGANAIQDLKDLATGLTTATSEFIRPIHNFTRDVYRSTPKEGMAKVADAFNKAVRNEKTRNLVRGATIGGTAGSVIPGIGTIGGAITGGLAGLLGPENFANAVLSTYNTSVEDVMNRNVDPQKVLEGIYQHPVYAAMDISGIGGIGKKVGTGSKAVAKQLGPAQQILPGSQLSELNRFLTNSKLWSKNKQTNLYGGYTALQNMPFAKRQELVKNIVANTGDLKGKDLKLANRIKSDLRANEQELVRLGLLPADFSKQNTIAQYVMENLRDDTKLLHKDIMDIMRGNPLDKEAIDLLKNNPLGDRIQGLINKGEELYSQGKISLLTHKLAPSEDPLGLRLARHITSSDLPTQYERVIGRSTPEMLGDVLDDSLKLQLDRTASVREGLDVFNDVLDSDILNLGLKPEEKTTYLNAFRNSLKRDLQSGNVPDLAKALKASAIDTKVNPTLYKAIEGSFSRAKIDTVFNRFLNNWKKTVLATPSWIAGNRLGNWSLNAIEGVNIEDYADAIGKYNKYIPDVLKQQTSYNAYVNMGSEGLGKVMRWSSVKEPLSQIRSSIGRFKQGDKTLSDLGKLGADLYGGASNLTANPFFRAEASMEFTDRAANFIRQAKREAEATGKSVENILKKSQTDKDLFLKLNTQVNKSLGDYIGQNYALPTTIREGLGAAVPFYRFPVQTARTTLHQIANRPLAFATNVSMPARAGQQIYQGYISKHNLDQEQYKGGFPYERLPKNVIRTMTLPPTPLAMIAGRVTDPTEMMGMVNPLATNVKQSIEYKKFGDKYPTSKRYTKYKKAGMASKYKPNSKERARYILNNILESTFNPYILGRRVVVPSYYYAKEGGLNSLYDIESFTQNFDQPYRKTYPLEILGSIFGISTKSNYPKRGMTKKQMKEDISIAKNTNRNIQQNKKR